MIEYNFIPQTEYPCLNIPGQTKIGRYSGCAFWNLPLFGRERWVVGLHIALDYEKYFSEGKTPTDIITALLADLNKLPERIRKNSRRKGPKYGNLTPLKVVFWKRDTGEQFLEALLVTDEWNNRAFWGQPPLYSAADFGIAPRGRKKTLDIPAEDAIVKVDGENDE
jgi:hypothetical protein